MLLALFGTPRQEKGGEMPAPEHVYFTGKVPPSESAGLDRVSDRGA
jgi:hypothetical protein